MGDLNGWVLGDRLGAGGMGVVYRARRGSTEAALKMIHPAFATDEEFRSRFRREVEVSRLVTSAHAVHVVDFDVEGEQQWIATQLLEGPTLEQRIEAEGPLTGAALDELAVGVAQGILDLHRCGVIHRDIKPANIILSGNGAVLVDFGIAAAFDSTTITTLGVRVGSAGWMSPELARSGRVTSATDVFGWGLVVAYASTGEHPYGRGPAEAMLYRLTHEDPDIQAVPRRWATQVAAALRQDPSSRPSPLYLLETATARGGAPPLDATAIDLHPTSVSDGLPDGVVPGQGTPAAEKIKGSRRRAARAVVAVVALALAGSAAGGWAADVGKVRERVSAAGSVTASRPPEGAPPSLLPSDPPASSSLVAGGSVQRARSRGTDVRTSVRRRTARLARLAEREVSSSPVLTPLFDGPSFDGAAFNALIKRKRALRRFIYANRGQVVRIDASIPAGPGGLSDAHGFSWAEGRWFGGMEGTVERAVDGDRYMYYAHGEYVFSGYFLINQALLQNQGVTSASLIAITPTKALGLAGEHD